MRKPGPAAFHLLCAVALTAVAIAASLTYHWWVVYAASCVFLLLAGVQLHTAYTEFTGRDSRRQQGHDHRTRT